MNSDFQMGQIEEEKESIWDAAIKEIKPTDDHDSEEAPKPLCDFFGAEPIS